MGNFSMLHFRMRRLTKGLIALALTSFVLTVDCYSQQLVWKTVSADRDSRYRFYYGALSSYGESAVVTVTVVDDSIKSGVKVWQKILRSDDAGLTWRFQDPGLPGKRTQGQGSLRAIVMPDSLTVFAIGDSGIFIRSTDQGESWEHSVIGPYQFHHLHFHDTMNGIASCWNPYPNGYISNLFVTHDGGRHWDSLIVTTPVGGDSSYLWPWGVESLGGSSFRAMSYGAGPLYVTQDDWHHIDRSRTLFEIEDRLHVVTDLISNLGDTILAFGGQRSTDSTPLDRALILRSIDNGQSWEDIHFADSIVTNPRILTALDRSVLVMGGSHNRISASILLSADRGASWKEETIRLDSNSRQYLTCGSATVTQSGIILLVQRADIGASPSVILRGQMKNEWTASYERIVYATHIFPNPAVGSIGIVSNDYDQTVLVYDLLGREARHGKLDGTGHAQFDVSALPRGVYSVILKHNGIPLSIGKVAVVSK
jgi:photosystem II stability/assembly factor-like uncharacterized protein